MKRLMMTFILGSLLLAVAGCGGGGGGGGSNNDGEPVGVINVSQPGTYTINASYQITKNNATIKLTLVSIQVTSEYKLKMNCKWSAEGNSATVVKESDSLNTKMYLKDNLGNVYNHYQGEGAAYTETSFITGTSVTGAFYFPNINSNAQSITFYDDNQSAKIGPITINRS
jgi:hypothetical protein